MILNCCRRPQGAQTNMTIVIFHFLSPPAWPSQIRQFRFVICFAARRALNQQLNTYVFNLSPLASPYNKRNVKSGIKHVKSEKRQDQNDGGGLH